MSMDVRAAIFAVASFCVLAFGTSAAPSIAGGYVPELPKMVSTETMTSDRIVPITANNDHLAMEVPAISGDASVGELPSPHTLEALVQRRVDDDADSSDEACLASTVYYEAKSESLEGQLAVAEVVLNRSRSGKFPASICQVVKQPSQFGFVRAGRYAEPPQNSTAWKRAIAVARVAMQGLWQSDASQSLYFHATHVAPRWANVTRVAKIGGHVFYR